MTKIATPSIHFVLKMNRTNKNGQHPVYVICQWYGRSEVSTGIFLTPNSWSADTEAVRRNHPLSVQYNQRLHDILSRCLSNIRHLEEGGYHFTAKDVLSGVLSSVPVSDTLIYKQWMERLMVERRLKYKTTCKYRYSFRLLVGFLHRENFLLTELSEGVVKDFLSSLSINDSTKRDVCSNISAVFHFAISHGVKVNHPFSSFKFTSVYKQGNQLYIVDLINVQRLKRYWLSLVVDDDGRMRDGVAERLMRRSSREFGILWWLVAFHLGGASPIDVALLRKSDCSRVSVGGESYWKVSFHRRKTNVQVEVLLKRDLFCQVGFDFLMGEVGGSYIFPIVTFDDAVRQQRQCSKASEVAIRHVRDAFSHLNREAFEENTITGSSIPMVDVEKVKMNVARHSFASAYLNSPGGSVRGIASLLGRSPNTIATYIKALRNEKEIADALSFIDG